MRHPLALLACASDPERWLKGRWGRSTPPALGVEIIRDLRTFHLSAVILTLNSQQF